ncbi:hypothetical protein ACA910_022227 [Epithemia clementina (nom. ined.)]
MKAWHCHGRSQRDLVDRLRQARIVKTLEVQQVLEQVDRQYYIGDSNLRSGVNPYLDTPQGISKAQTISAPHMHAHVLEEILPALQRNAADKQQQQAAAAASIGKDGQSPPQQPQPVKILDVGCGSGYLTACFGRWFCPKKNNNNNNNSESSSSSSSSSSLPILTFPGLVFGMDIHPELVEFTTKNIQRQDGDLLVSSNHSGGGGSSGVITLRHGNGWLGWPEEAPFDAIHVGAAADTFPTALAQQLALHGVLIVPVGPTGNVQTLLKVKRIAQSNHNNHNNNNNNNQDFVWDDFQVTQLLGVRYVPLVQRPE